MTRAPIALAALLLASCEDVKISSREDEAARSQLQVDVLQLQERMYTTRSDLEDLERSHKLLWEHSRAVASELDATRSHLSDLNKTVNANADAYNRHLKTGH